MTETYEINGKEYTKEEVEQAIRLTKEAWRQIKQVISDVVEAIAGAVQDLVERIAKHKGEKEHNYNCHVPMKIAMPPMPDVRIPRLAYARSNI